MKAHFSRYRKILTTNSENETDTLIVIYYAGHGVMLKNENNMVVLESEEKNRFYNLEAQSRALSSFKRSYIISIFDCCREYMAPLDQNTRGLGKDEDEYDPVDQKYLHSDTNFIQINGCPPNKFVPR